MNATLKQYEISVRGLFFCDLYAEQIEKHDKQISNYLLSLIEKYPAIQITVKADGINKYIFYKAFDGLRCGYFHDNYPESHTTDINRMIDYIVNLNHFTELYIKF